MRFEIKNIKPLGAVRMTQRGKYIKDNAKRYLNYKSVIYSEVLSQLNGEYKPIDGAIEVTILFNMPIPTSWPKEKKWESVDKYCTTKPDVDNLIKGLFDALNGLLWVDDNRIVAVHTVKVYSFDPGIEFTVNQIGGLSYGQAKKKENGKSSKGKETTGTRRNISKRL
jgi:Holliday junction resolvase RusA-like endonuclease